MQGRRERGEGAALIIAADSGAARLVALEMAHVIWLGSAATGHCVTAWWGTG